MSKAPYIPHRGDVVWLVLDPRIGHEQSGRRPALVLSPRLFTERTGLAVVCPITSTVKGLPFEIVLTGMKTRGAVLPIHVRSIDVAARKSSFIERAPALILDLTVQAVLTMLGAS